jgi:hypothetical protein
MDDAVGDQLISVVSPANTVELGHARQPVSYPIAMVAPNRGGRNCGASCGQ